MINHYDVIGYFKLGIYFNQMKQQISIVAFGYLQPEMEINTGSCEK